MTRVQGIMLDDPIVKRVLTCSLDGPGYTACNVTSSECAMIEGHYEYKAAERHHSRPVFKKARAVVGYSAHLLLSV